MSGKNCKQGEVSFISSLLFRKT